MRPTSAPPPPTSVAPNAVHPGRLSPLSSAATTGTGSPYAFVCASATDATAASAAARIAADLHIADRLRGPDDQGPHKSHRREHDPERAYDRRAGRQVELHGQVHPESRYD